MTQNSGADPKRSEQHQSLDDLYLQGVSIEAYLEILATRLCGPPPTTEHWNFQAGEALTMPSAKERAERDRVSEQRRSVAWKALRRDLVGESLMALGCRERDSEGFWAAEVIPPRFWRDAGLRMGFNQASNEDRKYERICIVESMVATPTQTADAQTGSAQDVAPQSKRKPGRPSEGVKITAAIESCAVPPDFFDRVEWEDREKAYRGEIKRRFGIDTLKVKKFETKTLKKYETRFRALTGR